VIVRARVSDPDGVERVTLYYRRDGTESFQAIDMTDDGGGADYLSGDGIYSGSIEGIGVVRATAEFYLQAYDGEGFERFHPPGAPEETFLYQYRDNFRVYGVPSYRIVMRARDYQELRSRSWNSNHPLPASLIYADERIFHRVAVRYRGSPWMRRDSLTGERKGFRVRLSDENPLRGSVRLMFDEQLADRTFQVDRLVNYFMHHVGNVTYGERRHVDLIVAGRHLGTYEDVLVIDRLYLKRAFGEENADGELYKLDAYYEIDDGGGFVFKRPFWIYQTDKEKIRFNFKKRSREKEDDFSNLFKLLALMDLNRTGNAEFDALAPELLDLKSWVNAISVFRAVHDWDSIAGSTNKNVYLYLHPDGKWRVFPWDHDCALWPSRDPRSYMYPPAIPQITRLLQRRESGRLYQKAIWELLQGPYKNEVVDPIFAEVYALLGPGPGAMDPAGRSNFLRIRRDFLLGWVINPSSFTILTNGGAPFHTKKASVRLRGRGPYEMVSMTAGGTPVALTWPNAVTWEINVTLECGENEIVLAALDASGEEVGRDSIVVTYDAAPAVTIDPPGASFRICGSEKQVRFIASALDPQQDPLTYEWSVTGGAVIEAEAVPLFATATFTEGGEYTVSCAVSDGNCDPVIAAAQVVVEECSGELIHVGDSNCDGEIDIADAICTLEYLFGSGETGCTIPCCAANQDSNNDGGVDIADAVRLLGYLFASEELVGPDGTAGVETCTRYPSATVTLPCAAPCAE